jgi:hypothetical protein
VSEEERSEPEPDSTPDTPDESESDDFEIEKTTREYGEDGEEVWTVDLDE